MKIIFAGTPPFAASALEALIQAGHEICLVLSQPDRPCGRGMKLTPSPVKALALAHDIAVQTPRTLSLKKDEQEALAIRELLAQQQADLMVVAAYGAILPKDILEIPKGIGPNNAVKCLNIHASLLPRWRGAAPITRAIELGDAQFGVTLMKMDVGLDTGPMLMQEAFDLDETQTTTTLTEKVAALGADMLVRLLQNPHAITMTEQPEDGVTYAHKVLKEEGKIDFSLSAESIARKIRAFTPFPSCFCTHNDTVIKFWQAQVEPMQGLPGQVLKADKNGLIVACAKDALRITQLQRPGKPKMNVQSFLQGYPINAGESFK